MGFPKMKKYWVEVAGFLLLFVLISSAALSARGKDITNKMYDPVRTTESRNEVVVVGIDDASLQSLGAWPFDREIFSRLTDTLIDGGVKAIAYDVLFLETRSEGDALFKGVLTDSKTPVILGAKIASGKYYSSFLVDSTATKITSALVNVSPDKDGKVRVYPRALQTEGVCKNPLALALFNVVTFKEGSSCEKEEVS